MGLAGGARGARILTLGLAFLLAGILTVAALVLPRRARAVR